MDRSKPQQCPDDVNESACQGDERLGMQLSFGSFALVERTGSAAVDLDGRPGGRAGLAGGEVVDYRGAPGFADCPASRMI